MFVRSAYEKAEAEFLFQSLPFMSSKAEEKPQENQTGFFSRSLFCHCGGAGKEQHLKITLEMPIYVVGMGGWSRGRGEEEKIEKIQYFL